MAPPSGGTFFEDAYTGRMPPVMTLVQIALACGGLYLLMTWVLPALKWTEQRRILLEVWVPLVVIMPALFTVGHVGSSVRGLGWIPVGSHVLLGALAVGAALMSGLGTPRADAREASNERPLGPGLAIVPFAAWFGAGLLLLLVGAAHNLELWTGQAIFALAAIVLWMRCPDAATSSTPSDATGSLVARRAALAGSAAMLCAVGQGLAAWRAGPTTVGAVVIMTYGAIIIIATVRAGGPEAGATLGGWTAAYGVTIGIGALCLVRLVPAAHVYVMDPTKVDTNVARGFGAFSTEATLLMLLPVTMSVLAGRRPGLQRLVGAVIVVGAASLAVVRLMAV